MSTPEPVLRIGDPRLRRRARRVDDPRDVEAPLARLHATLDDFRAAHGFGRAIAAPQLGIDLRLVALRLPDGPDRLVDPRIVERSTRTLTVWDDCLSFPDLYVRVRRAAAVTVESTTAEGARARWRIDDPHVAELVQHELDHLDGVLAVDRVTDADGLVPRAAFEADPERYAAQVDLKPAASAPPRP